MTNIDRQLILDTRMYRRGKNYGQEKYCKYCWACYYGNNCIAKPVVRSTQLLCVKAESRAGLRHFKSSFEELLQQDIRKRNYVYGLKKSDL